MSDFDVVPTRAGAWSDAQMEALFAEGFPAWIVGDAAVTPLIPRVRDLFAPFDLTLVDHDEQPGATGWGVPLAWDGDPDDLPDTFAGMLGRALALHDTGGVPDTLAVGGAVVHPAHKGTDVAEALLRSLGDVATAHRLERVVAPVRPTRKDLYPLMPIELYAHWVRDDDLPWDPWLRLHVRMGATIQRVLPQAQTMTGTVDQWRGWTGMEFPATGDYVIPRGMSILHVDRDHDLGTYVEPNVWVRHR